MTDPVTPRYFPSVRYFREADGHIGTWTVQNAEEAAILGPGYYDSPVNVPALAPGAAAALDPGGTPPAGDATPAPSAPSRRRRLAKTNRPDVFGG